MSPYDESGECPNLLMLQPVERTGKRCDIAISTISTEFPIALCGKALSAETAEKGY